MTFVPIIKHFDDRVDYEIVKDYVYNYAKKTKQAQSMWSGQSSMV